MIDYTYEIVKSWANVKGNVNSMKDIEQWISSRNENFRVDVEKIDFSYDGFWHYDNKDGYIRNDNNSFFQLAGYQEIEDDHIVAEQPIIIQSEIGYLGILCKKIDGCLNFLMQAKIEPGNVNVIQISPTIQATKSNFMRKHGGKEPHYLSYFENSSSYEIIVDQIQSEQSARFYKKRNRNIILYIDEDIPVYESHKWMTLGQIKELMKKDNLVNMDTRTVLSCIPFMQDGENLEEISGLFKDKSLFNSIFKIPDYNIIHNVFNSINNFKMYRRESSRLVPIKSLKGWRMTNSEIVCKTPYDFKVIYCRIEIEGREVKYWEQPLIEAIGVAVIGVFTTVKDGIRKYLVKTKQEMGCFDSAELGPLIQIEPSNKRNNLNELEALFMDKLEKNEGIKKDVIMSEEGGRFYHERNRNVIIEIKKDMIESIPEGYFWMDYSTISEMIQYNNCVNIQLRNLMALIDL